MDRLKYVIFDRSDRKGLAVLFDANIFHNEIRIRGGGKPVSAGFANIRAVPLGNGTGEGEVVEVKCYGKSESLNLESREAEDTAIVERMLSVPKTPVEPPKEDQHVQTRTPNKRKRSRNRKSNFRDIQREDT